MLPARRDRFLVAVLAVGTFTGVLNIYVLGPVVTLIATEFDVSVAAVGQLATVHATVAGLVGLLAAPLMDRFPRAHLLRFGAGLLILGMVMSAAASGFGMLFFGRAIAGAGAAFLLANCYAAVGDAFRDPTARNRAMAVIASATGISGVIGMPILSYLAAWFGWRWAVGALVVPLLIVALGVGLLPVAERPVLRRSLLQEVQGRSRLVLGSRSTTWLLGAGLIRSVVWSGSLVYVAALWLSLFDFSLEAVGWIILVYGAAYFVGSHLAPSILRHLSPQVVYTAATLLQMAAMLGAFAVRTHVVGLLLLTGVIHMAAGAVVFVTTNILLQDSLPGARGAVMALSSTTTEFGAAIGAAVAGLVLAVWGYVAIFPTLSLLLPVSLLCLWWSTRAVRAPAPASTS